MRTDDCVLNRVLNGWLPEYGRKVDMRKDKIWALLNKINNARIRNFKKSPSKTMEYINERTAEALIKEYQVTHQINDFTTAANKLSYELSQKIIKGEWV